MKAGVKNIGTVFLMTDAQVSDEKFLVLINDLLASGEIPDLFPDDEVENIIGGKWSEVIYCSNVRGGSRGNASIPNFSRPWGIREIGQLIGLAPPRKILDPPLNTTFPSPRSALTLRTIFIVTLKCASVTTAT